MSISNAFSIGQNGLNAANFGTNVASQNLTNAATPGYTRRIANFDPNPLSQGGGVLATGTTRVQDQFLEKRSLGAATYNGESQGRVQTLSVLDTVFADGSGTVGDALDQFDSSLSDMAASPNSTAARQVVLGRADDLAQAFHRTSTALDGARTDANSRISDAVTQVNDKADEVGSLGAQIMQGKNAGQDVSELLDKRDQLIRDISGEIPVTVINDDSGGVTLMLSGARTLVGVDNQVHHLTATTDATSGDIHVTRETSGVTEDITSFMTSGTIGGMISARDGALADARNSLDQLASDVTSAYNAVQSVGVGTDGNTGRNLFTPLTGTPGAAANIGVSSDVIGHPEFLGAAQSADSLPSDNRNALALVAVRDQKPSLGGTSTIQDAFSSLVAAGGSATRSANDQADHASAALSQVDALRDSASGVSTDDEMISLMKYQRSYQASLQVIETADAMLSDLLNMNVGR
jgi:flagellar hook-associated protein 1 FlgK